MEEVDDCPNDTLRRKCCCAVSETEAHVEKDLSAPPNREEDSGYRVEHEPTVPSLGIQLKDEYLVAGVSFPSFLDESNNCL